MVSTENISATQVAVGVIVLGFIVAVSGAALLSVEEYTVTSTESNDQLLDRSTPDVIEYESMELEKRLLIDEVMSQGSVTREGDTDLAGVIIITQGSEEFMFSIEKSSPARNFVTASGVFIIIAGLMLYRRYSEDEINTSEGVSKSEEGEWEFDIDDEKDR